MIAVMEADASSLNVRSNLGSAQFSLTPTGDSSRSYRATVTAGLMAAAVDVGVARRRVGDFFGGLAEEWRGWDGVRELELMPPSSDYAFPVVRLAATADGRGHVTLRVEAGNPWLPTVAPEEFATHVGPGPLTEEAAWVVEAVLRLDAGALDEIAAACAQLPFDSAGLW